MNSQSELGANTKRIREVERDLAAARSVMRELDRQIVNEGRSGYAGKKADGLMRYREKLKSELTDLYLRRIGLM